MVVANSNDVPVDSTPTNPPAATGAEVPTEDAIRSFANAVWNAPSGNNFTMFEGDALASLTTCSINLNPSCDFRTTRKYKEYTRAWRQTAPIHCRGKRRGKGEKNGKKEDADHPQSSMGLVLDNLCR